MMKLTTPATASAPYTDDAPPVSTSTRLISDDGMRLRSAAWAGAVRVARRHAAAVDQRQGPLRAEIAKVDFGGTRRAVRHARGLRGADRRQLVEEVFDAGRTGELHVLVGDHRDRRGRRQVRLRNARAGDDDVLAAGDRGALRIARRRRLTLDGAGRVRLDVGRRRIRRRRRRRSVRRGIRVRGRRKSGNADQKRVVESRR